MAIVPIGGNFTTRPQGALNAVKLINSKTVIPMHSNTVKVIEQNPHASVHMVDAETSVICVVLKPGQSLTL